MLLNELEKEQASVNEKYRLKSRFLFFLLPILLIVLLFGLYHAYKPMPLGLDFVSQDYVVNESDIKFLFDHSASGVSGNTSQQVIFDQLFKYIDEAKQYILVDMFLFNDWSKQSETDRKLSAELASHLLAKKAAEPDIKIDVITDPINTVYGGADSEYLQRLSSAGISVIVTDLKPLPDPNPWYSAWWRTFIVWFGNNSSHGWLVNPFSPEGPKVTVRSYLELFNFKANHRKVFVADNQGQLISIVSSANAHDASWANANAAVSVRGPLAESIYQSESAVAHLSGRALYSLPSNLVGQAPPPSNKYASVKLVTEHQIKQAILAAISNLSSGDEIKIALFYLSDQDIVKALLASAKKGVLTKLVLDANQQAFGYEKIGVPNLPIARKLTTNSEDKIAIKWAKSGGEQFHTKLFTATNKTDKQMTVILGSANLTRRNLDNYNLESDLVLTLNTDWDLAAEINNYFEQTWFEAESYELYNQSSWWLVVVTWLQERTGMGTF